MGRRFWILDFGFWILDQIGRRVWIDILVEFVVHHTNRGGPAAGQTFDELDAVISFRASRDRFVTILALNPSCRAQVFHGLMTSGHRATERATHADMRFARAL